MKLRIVALISEMYFSTCLLSIQIVCAEIVFHKSFFFRNNKTAVTVSNCEIRP